MKYTLALCAFTGTAIIGLAAAELARSGETSMTSHAAVTQPAVQPAALMTPAPERTAAFDPPPEILDLMCIFDCMIEALCLAPEPPCPAPARCQPCISPSLGTIWLAIEDDEFASEDKAWVASDLDVIETTLENIQDDQVGPNLTPVDAGMPGDGRTFTSLTECAAQCLAWAQEAQAEIHTNQPDHEVIGYALDSIRLALPQFRTLGDLD